MKQLLFTFITTLASIWLEVSFSTLGLVLPVLFLQLFYITIVRKWRWGIFVALVSCAMIDSLLGYFSLPSALCVIICAAFWRNIGDCSRLELQFLPVAFSMFGAMLILFAVLYLQYGGYVEWLSWTKQFFFSIVVTSIITPTYFRLQDLLAKKMDILTYANVQREELYSAN